MVQLAKASNSTPPAAYNMEDGIGNTPILCIVKSMAAVEFLLFDSGLDDLALRNAKNGGTILEKCVTLEMLTPRIVNRLRHQVNGQDGVGDPPSFYTMSTVSSDCTKRVKILEIILSCEGLNDDAIETYDGQPLLHRCVQSNILSESILISLQKQFGVKWRGILPAEAGNFTSTNFNLSKYSTVISFAFQGLCLTMTRHASQSFNLSRPPLRWYEICTTISSSRAPLVRTQDARSCRKLRRSQAFPSG